MVIAAPEFSSDIPDVTLSAGTLAVQNWALGYGTLEVTGNTALAAGTDVTEGTPIYQSVGLQVAIRGGATLTNAGTITFQTPAGTPGAGGVGDAPNVVSGGVFLNQGTVTLDRGAILRDTGGAFVNDGTVAVHSADVSLASLTGTSGLVALYDDSQGQRPGPFFYANPGTVSIAGSVAAGEGIVFAPPPSGVTPGSVLELGDVRLFAGTVGGFVPGDAIRLDNASVTDVSFQPDGGASGGGTLLLTLGGSQQSQASIRLASTPSDPRFAVAADGAGNEILTVSSAPAPPTPSAPAPTGGGASGGSADGGVSGGGGTSGGSTAGGTAGGTGGGGGTSGGTGSGSGTDGGTATTGGTAAPGAGGGASGGSGGTVSAAGTVPVAGGIAQLGTVPSAEATVAGAPPALTVTVNGTTLAASGAAQVAFLDGTLDYDPSSQAASIVRLYNAALGRAPDPAGLTAWVQQLQAGVPLSTIAEGFAGSSEFQARFPGVQGDTASFVAQLYQNVLHRAGSSQEISAWVGQLRSGTSQGAVLAAFSESPENRADTAGAFAGGIWVPDAQAAAVARLYHVALDRAPDAAGLAAWTQQAKAGQLGLQAEAQAFVQSPEFVAAYGTLGNAQFVTQLYHNALGRAPDAAGLAAWTGALDGGALTRGQVVTGFSQSQEEQALLAPQTETHGVVLAT